jgi:membrane associated rhomboid family serine protease
MNTNKHESEESIKLARIFIRVHPCLPRRKHCEGGFIRGAPVVSLAQTQCAALIESMFGVTTSDDYRPVTWMGRYPVDVTTMLVGVHVACAVVACVFTAIPGLAGTLDYFYFDSARIWNGLQLWRLGSYAFVHPPSSLLWFAVEMYFLFVFGREVERFIGRRAYVALYLLLLFAPTIMLTVAGPWHPSGFAGSPALHFGIFVAFATIYPRAELFLRIMAKWVAVILGAVYTLQLLAYHAWAELIVVWTSIGAAFLFIELRGAGPELVWLSDLKARFGPKPKFHVVQKARPGRAAEADDVYASIDPILDKISKFGIGSLTANERRQLDRERERLLKKSE